MAELKLTNTQKIQYLPEEVKVLAKYANTGVTTANQVAPISVWWFQRNMYGYAMQAAYYADKGDTVQREIALAKSNRIKLFTFSLALLLSPLLGLAGLVYGSYKAFRGKSFWPNFLAFTSPLTLPLIERDIKNNLAEIKTENRKILIGACDEVVKKTKALNELLEKADITTEQLTEEIKALNAITSSLILQHGQTIVMPKLFKLFTNNLSLEEKEDVFAEVINPANNAIDAAEDKITGLEDMLDAATKKTKRAVAKPEITVVELQQAIATLTTAMAKVSDKMLTDPAKAAIKSAEAKIHELEDALQVAKATANPEAFILSNYLKNDAAAYAQTNVFVQASTASDEIKMTSEFILDVKQADDFAKPDAVARLDDHTSKNSGNFSDAFNSSMEGFISVRKAEVTNAKHRQSVLDDIPKLDDGDVSDLEPEAKIASAPTKTLVTAYRDATQAAAQETPATSITASPPPVLDGGDDGNSTPTDPTKSRSRSNSGVKV